MATKYQSDDRLVYSVSYLQNGHDRCYHRWPWPGHAQQLPASRGYYIQPLSCFDSIPELCTASGLHSRPSGRECAKDVFCQVGAVLVKLCTPLGSYLGTDTDLPHSTSCMGSASSWFSASTHSSRWRVGHIPATVLPLSRDDHVNNHLFIGINPRHSQHSAVSSRGILANQKVSSPSPRSTLRRVSWGHPRKSEG